MRRLGIIVHPEVPDTATWDEHRFPVQRSQRLTLDESGGEIVMLPLPPVVRLEMVDPPHEWPWESRLSQLCYRPPASVNVTAAAHKATEVMLDHLLRVQEKSQRILRELPPPRVRRRQDSFGVPSRIALTSTKATRIQKVATHPQVESNSSTF
ncbi:MAG: uncharacterized protein KVP18_004336 [Porospora cf. gigantea A]|uniref:uncharacterized protein n=1 Tax=Porospora cf. gigantea A TaxID=2853593 RepID=UPI00355A9DE1|nr:MAG: hypothetical protein KVP18_004336 [Porospora cf. gigantea A]